MIIVNPVLNVSLAIYPLISNMHLWNYVVKHLIQKKNSFPKGEKFILGEHQYGCHYFM